MPPIHIPQPLFKSNMFCQLPVSFMMSCVLLYLLLRALHPVLFLDIGMQVLGLRFPVSLAVGASIALGGGGVLHQHLNTSTATLGVLVEGDIAMHLWAGGESQSYATSDLHYGGVVGLENAFPSPILHHPPVQFGNPLSSVDVVASRHLQGWQHWRCICLVSE